MVGWNEPPTRYVERPTGGKRPALEKPVTEHIQNLIVGQGIAGTTLAWRLLEAGQSVLLADRADSMTASRVAAGLVTPWTGRRMTQSDDYSVFWSEAASFYTDLQKQLNVSFWTEKPMLRVFLRKSEEGIFGQRREEAESESLIPWNGQLQSDGPRLAGGWMLPAGRLHVPQFLQASLNWFADRAHWVQHDLNPDSLTLTPEGVSIPELDIRAERVIFCQGAVDNSWFAGVPDNPSRGDVINVSVENFLHEAVIHHSVWAAPEVDGTLTVGATYDWKVLRNEPLASGRRQLLRSLRRFIEGDIHVEQHVAAVRPTMKDYQPVLGQHPQHHRLWIFNGLGSRGVLTAPRLSRMLAESMLQDTKIPSALNVQRLHRSPDRKLPLTQRAQDITAACIGLGDTVVDATVGNGFDTVFLAQAVGDTGCVHGFDVQQTAIDSTQQRLKVAGINHVILHHRSHAELSGVVPDSVKAAMFNLGYLPRSDHSIVTQADSTIAALRQVLERLANQGIISVLAYRGHEGGAEEALAVERWLQEQPGFELEIHHSHPRRETSPVLYVLRSREADTPVSCPSGSST